VLGFVLAVFLIEQVRPAERRPLLATSALPLPPGGRLACRRLARGLPADRPPGQNALVRWDRLGSSYDRVATRYERTFSAELDGKPRDRELLAAFAAAVADPVLEVGCGPGQVGAYLRGRGRRVIGIDLSTQMARIAAGRLDAAAVADMRELPVHDDIIGGLLAFYSVIHVRRRELGALLREFRRVLRPGGRVLLSVHEGDGEITSDDFLGEPVPFVATLYDLSELSAAAKGAGLDVAVAERRSPYQGEHPTCRLYMEAVRPR
jgi:SAM-dependent methyltransferase